MATGLGGAHGLGGFNVGVGFFYCLQRQRAHAVTQHEVKKRGLNKNIDAYPLRFSSFLYTLKQKTPKP